MSTVQPPRPRAKPLRTARLFEVDGKLVLELRTRTPRTLTATRFWVEDVPADFGRGFALDKFSCDGDRVLYHVNVCGALSTCECPGFLRWGHCRHVDALTTLHHLGRI